MTFDPEKHCGAPARQRNGEPCELVKGFGTDHVGSGKCKFHNGATETGTKAAKRESVEREAQRMVALAGVDQHPLDHLLESLHHAAALERVWGEMVAELDEKATEELAADEDKQRVRGELGYEVYDHDRGTDVVVLPKDRLLAVNAKGEAKVHPYVERLEAAIERRAKLSKMCLDAGVAERQIKIVEVQVQLTQKALERTFDKLGLSADKKQEARRVFAGYLRAGG